MLKVGDRVEAIVDHIESNDVLLKGDTGTVCILHGGDGSHGVGVEWDRACRGHDCGGYFDHGYGWNVNKRDIRLIDEAFCIQDIEVESEDLFAMIGGCLV
jgi:hypothetical protein